MKLIIELDDDIAKGIRGENDCKVEAREIVRSFQATISKAIANGTPVSNKCDLISRSDLKEVFEEHEDRRGDLDCDWRILIDNAPTVVIDEQTYKDAYEQGYTDGWKERYGEPNERTQGECKTCIHRDPEDKKCDCGDLERQGCPFPVSDDYYCKYYERGEEE